MGVSDDQMAALRAYLAGSTDEWQRLHWQLIECGDVDGYGNLVYAAFVTAVRRRFTPTWTRAEVIGFIADIRAVIGEQLDLIDPRAAENLIRRALDDPVADDLDQQTKGRAQIALLSILIKDEDLDDTGLDEYLETVRTLTSQWWSR